MRQPRKILILVLAALATASLLTLKGQQKKSTFQLKSETLDERVARLPIADFEAPDSVDAEKRFLRRLRNTRHNSSFSPQGVKRSVLSENMEPVLLDLPLSDQRQEPAIPAENSDAVIIGNVADVRAYLSEDKTSVYSEATITIEEVLKEAPSCALRPGSSLDAERSGGAVRFPSGKVLRRASLGRGIPQSGHRYLLFLSYNEDGKDFSIITGYELSSDYVFPLDGTITLKKGGRFQQFKAYEAYTGTSRSTFLADVRAAMAAQTSL